MNRRTFLQVSAGAGLALGATKTEAQEAPKFQKGTSPWPLCLNTSSIRPTPFQDKLRVAQEAGYDGIEVWINELETYEKEGGDLKALAAEIKDRGLFIPNVIGLWDSMPMEEEAWKQSLEVTRNRMRMCAAAGSQHVAAIPAPDREDFDLKIGAQRYRELLKIGREEYGIIVAVEFVGFLKGVHRLGQAAAIAIDANDRDACIIADTFHLFRGDSGFNGLTLLGGNAIADFHWNDVPADPPREQQADEHRVYPGDGILPLVQVLKDLKAINYTGPLSYEAFNRPQWEQDPKLVAETALNKMRELIAKAI